jgi:3-phosphoshikimate 1-carboxyvinyltransferase
VTDFYVEPARLGAARITVPGDKSISHRALMLGSIAKGVTDVGGFLAGADCLATLSAFAEMGVEITRHDDTHLQIRGVGIDGLQPAAKAIDLGNSGTAMRLMAGLLAGQRFNSVLTGDASLNTRPMNRIVTPLTSMGAAIEADCDGTPPLQIAGGLKLRAIDYALPMASAQVKSCVLLAGLYADGVTTVIEPAVTRDHTERMLRTMNVQVDTNGSRISLAGRQEPLGCAVDVPADLSSAAFLILAALLAEDADVLIENVGVNPTRTGVIEILQAMGADIQLENSRQLGDEPVADIRVRSSQLRGGAVDPALVSLAIDEFPVIFIAAAAASGVSSFTGLAELRVKESDRIAAMASGLRTLGIDVEETPDGARIVGGRFGGGEVESCDDHRIAMAFAIAGTVAAEPVRIREVDNVETSFPGFARLLGDLGLNISVEGAT